MTGTIARMADRRTALLDAALAEIAVCGTRGMRVDQVAARAGVSVALIYHHFGDRPGLLNAALNHIDDAADAYTRSTSGTGRRRLINSLVSEIQDTEKVRRISTAWGELRSSAIFDESLRDTLSRLTAKWVDDVADLIRDGQRDGSISAAGSVNDLAAQLTATVEGISWRWLSGMMSTRTARRTLTDMIEALLGPDETLGAT